MLLKYTGDTIKVKWRRTNPVFEVKFSPLPDKEIPDDLAKRLLTNPDYRGRFVLVEEQPLEYPCDECNFVAKSEAGLGSHKRKHKEQQ